MKSATAKANTSPKPPEATSTQSVSCPASLARARRFETSARSLAVRSSSVSRYPRKIGTISSSTWRARSRLPILRQLCRPCRISHKLESGAGDVCEARGRVAHVEHLLKADLGGSSVLVDLGRVDVP